MKQRDSIAVNYSFIIQNVASIAHFANSRIQFKSMVRFQLDSITCILLFSLFTHQIYIQFFLILSDGSLWFSLFFTLLLLGVLLLLFFMFSLCIWPSHFYVSINNTCDWNLFISETNMNILLCTMCNCKMIQNNEMYINMLVSHSLFLYHVLWFFVFCLVDLFMLLNLSHIVCIQLIHVSKKKK